MTTINLNYKDIIILRKISKKPISVSNTSYYVTGGVVSLYFEENINIQESIDKLFESKLIRKNYPVEFLKFLTVEELKNFLKLNELPVSGSKKILIDRISNAKLDSKISALKSYSEFYIITIDGKNVLDKYRNLLWFIDNKNNIFEYGNCNSKFNYVSIFENPESNLVDEMIEYFQDRDYLITSKLYYLKENYLQSLKFGLNDFLRNLENLIIDIINSATILQRNNLVSSASYNYNFWIVQGWISKPFIYFSNKNTEISALITDLCNSKFKYSDEISITLFTDIINSFLLNDQIMLSQKLNELVNEIFEKHPIIHDNYEKNLKYNTKDFDTVSFLIEHLDAEALEILRDAINLRIEELK